MCGDCGCEVANASHFKKSETKKIHLAENILQKNKNIAHKNSHWFEDHHIKAINIMSSPGAGKTALLEKTISDLSEQINICTLVGDQQTDNDAQRLKKSGGMAQQISTHSSCHLDAQMVADELGVFVKPEVDLLFIENVGNLVCPSAFDLGEQIKVALLSTTEGEDKPIKYPVLFNKASLILITKTDLMPYLKWDKDKCVNYIRQVNSEAKIIFLSSETGEGLDEWYDYLKGELCV
ncbi:MAG: hydrogenase nickel incorporation protein HypB [Bdellovibrionaceae bacterium]|jgi:hydrogenase nickel incorporation protein HypB|nr:hydrogenase nickel incorporation protein HypB [Pseudobdellovibrionaceae bacterium]